MKTYTYLYTYQAVCHIAAARHAVSIPPLFSIQFVIPMMKYQYRHP